VTEGPETAAGDMLAAVTPVTRIRLTRPTLKALRLALLSHGSPFTVELELVEERFSNGDVAVRLARPDKPEDGERVLGVYRREEQLPASLLDDGV
jgi:hypothetical protein